MNQARSILVFLIATMVFSQGCDRKAENEIGFGSVNNSVYQNEYFGLTVKLPPEWSIQDQEAIINGYALNFVVSFTTEDDELALNNILNTIDFK